MGPMDPKLAELLEMLSARAGQPDMIGGAPGAQAEFVQGAPMDSRLDMLGMPPGDPGMGDHQMPHQGSLPVAPQGGTPSAPGRPSPEMQALMKWLASRAGPNPGF